MTDGSVLIIGAGLSGLAAGCFAQMNGYRSRIVVVTTGIVRIESAGTPLIL